MIEVIEADSPGHIEAVRDLFVEYAESLGFSLCFQSFDRELAALPGRYARPRGRLLLALDSATPAGCVGLRPHDDDACEMKRLYVRPAYRGSGLGRRLAQSVIEAARDMAYCRMVLDTLATMTGAQALYRSLGFREIAPYYENPIAGAAFMELALRADDDRVLSARA